MLQGQPDPSASSLRFLIMLTVSRISLMRECRVDLHDLFLILPGLFSLQETILGLPLDLTSLYSSKTCLLLGLKVPHSMILFQWSTAKITVSIIASETNLHYSTCYHVSEPSTLFSSDQTRVKTNIEKCPDSGLENQSKEPDSCSLNSPATRFIQLFFIFALLHRHGASQGFLHLFRCPHSPFSLLFSLVSFAVLVSTIFSYCSRQTELVSSQTFGSSIN